MPDLVVAVARGRFRADPFASHLGEGGLFGHADPFAGPGSGCVNGGQVGPVDRVLKRGLSAVAAVVRSVVGCFDCEVTGVVTNVLSTLFVI